MTRRLLLSAACLVPALGATVLAAPAESRGHHSCRPEQLRFSRAPGAAYGRLTWRAPRQARYRVSRNGKVAGQTRGASMAIRVMAGQRYRFTVAVAGRAGRCSATLTRREPFHPPSAPSGVAVSSVGATSATLSWAASRRGDGRPAGYRVYRDGAVYRQLKGTRATVAVSSSRRVVLRVAAVDTRGHLSARSAAVTFDPDHAPPAAPSALTAEAISESAVRLSWQTGGPGAARVVGYRVHRDGAVLGQVAGTTFTASALVAGRGYTFSVAARDARGYLSDAVTVQAQALAPSPSAGHAHAFLLASTDDSFRDFQAHYRSIGYVHPTYFQCDRATGALDGRDDPRITRWASARGVKVLARFDCQHGATINRILDDPATRQATLDGLAALPRRYGYDGISLDVEAGYASDREAYTSFVADLAARLHAQGKLLSVVVAPKYVDAPTHPRSGMFDYRALAPYPDFLFLMAWGIHWSTSAPGPLADLPWVNKVAEYAAAMPDPEKWVMAAPMYGFDWPGDGGADEPATALEFGDVQALLERTGAVPRYDQQAGEWTFGYTGADGKPHTVWYADGRGILARLNVGRSRGLGGVGVWRLGNEDQAVWTDAPLAPPAA